MKFDVCNLEILATISHEATDRENIMKQIYFNFATFDPKYRKIRTKINNSKV